MGAGQPPGGGQDVVERKGTIEQPVQRFLQLSDASELRVGEIEELLSEYKRLAGHLKRLGTF